MNVMSAGPSLVTRLVEKAAGRGRGGTFPRQTEVSSSVRVTLHVNGYVHV